MEYLNGFPTSHHEETYEVFLSFRGEDTRDGFTDHLYHALSQEGIYTFRDTEELPGGSKISSELLKAITDSRIAVIILSANYADSTWCLRELAKIVECKSTGLAIYPVFYQVKPSEVREQTGNFGKHFRRHERNPPDNDIMEVNKWRKACNEVAKIPGPYLEESDGDRESEVIQEIANEILEKLDNCSGRDHKNLIGMDARIEKIKSYLELGTNDVLTIGISGMEGSGKTTLTKAVYENIRSKFYFRRFIDVRDRCSKEYGSGRVNDILENDIMEKSFLREKNVIIVLDGVENLDQIQVLGATLLKLGPGSRVIITARDEQTLRAVGVQRDKMFEVEKLTDDEALQLFCKIAFEENEAPDGEYIPLSKEFVNYAGGHPVATKRQAFFLRGRGLNEWSAGLARLREPPE